MIERGPASENEVVLAFLRAEIDSPKPDVQGCYARSLERWGLDRVNLIDNADLNDEDANHNRVAVLDECRGFRRRIALFQGFPTDTKWRRVVIEPSDFHRLKCVRIKDDTQWRTLTKRTRLIMEAARNLADVPEVASIVHGMMQAILGGSVFPPLIVAEVGDALVLVEGNKRATAYAAVRDKPFDAFLGTSSTMGDWTFGRD